MIFMSDNSDYIFVDTNIIVYCFDDANQVKKRKSIEIMEGLWDSQKGVLSLQVLKEFFVTVTRKLVNKMDFNDAKRVVYDLMTWNLFIGTKTSFIKAIEIVERYGFSIWDASVLTSAIMSNCGIIYTEDLQNNQIIEGVRVVNPFV